MLNKKMIVVFFSILFSPALADKCHPQIDPNQKQYLIGYGSLMQQGSKTKTDPLAGISYPAQIFGYKRGWFTHGAPLPITFLGAVKQNQSHFNAVIFNLPNPKTLKDYDTREKYYCRELVSPKNIRLLAGKNIPKGQMWIYITKPSEISMPTQKMPIAESYVDIYLSGCLEMEKKYGLKNFARQCIITTCGWSSHWVNDRKKPLRPLVYPVNTRKIDRLISNNPKHKVCFF